MYIGEREASVIDYIITLRKRKNRIEEWNRRSKEIRRRQQNGVGLYFNKGGVDRNNKENKKEERRNEGKRSVWSEKGIKYYHRKCEEWTCTQRKMKEIWRELQEKGSIMKVQKERCSFKMGRRNWYSKEWKEKKREMRKEFRKMRKR